MATSVQSQLFTSEERTKLAGIDSGAEVNVIEEVRVENPQTHQWTALPVTNKGVNIPTVTIPEEVSFIDFTLTDDGDDFVCIGEWPSLVVSKVVNGEAVIARISYDGTVYYAQLVEATQ